LKKQIFKAMARVTIIIEQSDGGRTEVVKEIAEGTLLTFNQIEDFTQNVKRELFPTLQEHLLRKSQKGFKKKNV
jgi:hypothetical protein